MDEKILLLCARNQLILTIMGKIRKKTIGSKLAVFIGVSVLFVSIAVIAACSKDDKTCKTCTNTATNTSKEYCDDALDTLEDSQAYKDGTTTCK